METLKVGIREFREKLASYLLETEVPVAITRHGIQSVTIFLRVASVARPSVRHSKKLLFVCSKCWLLKEFWKRRFSKTSSSGALAGANECA